MSIGPVGSVSLSDTGLTANTTYTYTISAIDGAGNESAKSAQVSATTQAATDTVAPSVPTNVRAVANAWNSVTLTWNASTDNFGVTRYSILRGGVLLSVVDGTVTTFNDRKTIASTAYSYTVKASDATARTSGLSAPATVTTPACVCTTVTLHPVSDISGTAFVPNAGTTRWTQLDEGSSDGDTTYIQGQTSGAGNAIFGMGGPAGKPYTVRVTYVARQIVTSGSPGTMNVRVQLLDGGTLIGTGTTHNLPWVTRPTRTPSRGSA